MSRQARIGLFFLAGVGLGLIALLWLQRLGPFGVNGADVEVRLVDAAGLQPGQPVVWKGVTVGYIRSVGRDGLQPIATVALEEGMPPCAECLAIVEMRDVFGAMHIRLECPDSPCTPWNGQTITGAQRPDMARVVASTGALIETVRPEDVHRLVGRFDTLTAIFASLAPRFEEVLEANPPAQVLAEVRDAVSALRVILAETQRQQLVANVGQTARNADSALHEMREALVEMRPVLRQIPSTLVRMDSLLANADAGLNEGRNVFAEIRPMLNTFTQSDGLAHRLLTDPEWARQVDSLLTRLNQSIELLNAGDLRVRARLGGGR